MLIGLQLYHGDEAANARQARAATALLGLEGIEPINLQFRDAPAVVHPGLATAAVLAADSIAVTGISHRRRPLTREIFVRLHDIASARGHKYFAFINSDIVVTQGAVDAVRAGGRDTYVLSRFDVYPPGQRENRMMTAGVDMWVVSTEWWPAHSRLFRPYIVGEMCWDNVYAAILMCHSNGAILNRDPLLLHDHHPALWQNDAPGARYNGMMAAIDAAYFSLWCQYWERLSRLREQGASAAEEETLRREIFVWRQSAVDAVKHVLRTARARYIYRRQRARWQPAPAQ